MTKFWRFELRTTDADAARVFYAGILGHDRAVIWPLHEQALARGARPHWLGHLGTEDVDRATADFVERGAMRLGPTRPMRDGGQAGVLRDPGGAVVAAPPSARGGRPDTHVRRGPLRAVTRSRGWGRGLAPLCAILVVVESGIFGCGRERKPEHESPRRVGATSERAGADADALADADRITLVAEGRAEVLPEEGVARVSAPDAAPRSDEPLSFLLITVDTLRPDLGFTGYGRPVSPNLDQFAQRAIVYEHAYSISTYTGFSIPPMMASRYPSEMPRTDRHEVKYLGQNVLLAERLRAAGYHTAGAASHFLFAPQLGWIDGFERFVNVPSEGTAPPGSSLDWYHSSRGLAQTAIELLSDPQITSGPFFIWIHFVDPHSQYLEHKGFSNFGHDPRGLYDGEVAYTDFYIGQVLSTLGASPLAEHTAIIFTADHGEAFGEHGEIHHGRHVWEEIVRIPLVVFAPGIVPRKIARRISAVEIAPTILDLAKLPEDPGARGRSFAPELYGADLPERPVLIDQPRNPYYPLKRAFIEGGYKLHDVPKPKTWLLFDLSRDPGETQDLVAGEPEILARIRESYEAFMSDITPVSPLLVAPPPSAAPRGKH